MNNWQMSWIITWEKKEYKISHNLDKPNDDMTKTPVYLATKKFMIASMLPLGHYVSWPISFIISLSSKCLWLLAGPGCVQNVRKAFCMSTDLHTHNPVHSRGIDTIF